MKNKKGLTKKQYLQKEAEKKIVKAVDRFNIRTISYENLYSDFIEVTLDEHKEFFKSLEKIINFLNASDEIDEKTKRKIFEMFPDMPELDKKAFKKINFYSREIRDLILACSIFRASTENL